MQWIRRLFSTQYMVKKKFLQGEITSSREAYRTSLLMALPAVLEMVSIALIGMADTAMVGRLGAYAISAVGLTGQPRLIFLSVFSALNVGVTVIVSRRKGENDPKAARLCMRQAILIALLLGAVVSVLAIILARPVMILAGANEETLTASVEYLQVIGAGLIFQILSMIICAAQRGVGFTKITMYVNIIANIVNVVFNYLLIEGNFGFPRLEVRGAAIATVLGGVVGMGLAIWSLGNRNTYLHIAPKDSWKPNRAMIKSLGRIGGGSMLEQLAQRTGFFLFAREIAGLGTEAMAANQIASQLMMLSFTFADGIGVATTSLVGQHLGMKRPDLSIMFGQIGQRLALMCALFLSLFTFFGRAWFPLLFTNEPRIIETCASIMIILAVIQPIQTSHIVMAGSLRGAGDTKFVSFTMLITVAVIRPSVAFLLAYVLHLGIIGAWCAIFFDQFVRLIMVFTRFVKGKWILLKF